MAVAYSEDIAAAGAVAGLPYGDNACAVAHGFYTGIAHQPWAAFVEAMRAEQQEPEEQRLVPLMVIHSANDTVVPIKERPEPSRFLDRLLRRRGHTRQHPGLHRGRRALRARPLRRSGGGTVVEMVCYDEPRFGRTHFWVGDREGRFDDTGPIGAAVQLLPAARARAVTAADWRGARQARLEGPGWHAERFQSSVSR